MARALAREDNVFGARNALSACARVVWSIVMFVPVRSTLPLEMIVIIYISLSLSLSLSLCIYIYIYICMFTLASRASASPASTVLLVRDNLFTAKAMSPCAR